MQGDSETLPLRRAAFAGTVISVPASQPPGRATVTPSSFREMFPALARQVWLDTPASAPGAMPVTAALASAITGWQEGSLGAADWEDAGPRARSGFARYLGVPEAHVALMGSMRRQAKKGAGSRIIVCSAQGAQVRGQVVRGGQGAGVVFAQYPALAVQGVLVQVPGGLYLTQRAQVVG